MKTRFDPPVLVLSVIICMAGTFLIACPLQVLLGVGSWLILCWCLRANPLCCLKRACPLCLFFLLIAALNLFTNHEGQPFFQLGWFQLHAGGMQTFLLFGLRLCLMVLYGAALLEGLSASLTARALKSLLSPLALLHVPLDALADVTVLSLRFMPLLAREYATLKEAQIIRGSMLAKKSRQPAHILSQEAGHFVALTVGMLRHAENLSLALDSRAYEPGAKRTQLCPFHMRPRDIVLAMGAAAYIAALVLI